ncbi:NAD-dependent epimerase/dehydratase family protein [Thermomonas fusca]|uniref:NAD-dependent epimerase/dehydratase family protein n=1 Tax=Thermomonas fusca TaxID=215690 RepID=A0A5R9PC00_9GAMM|nr:NAD-dependent epimerase/dehydratase family protein [Thermomonas fusca]TLX20892.1 NAD-dependent epimerase/dehydratase family protein [Thermomonas fusca]
MNRSALVLGAGGFLGRHLCRSLTAHGWHVVAATRNPTTFDDSSIENAVSPFDDASHFDDLVSRCSAVIHAAASTTPGSTAAQPQIEGNLRTTLALVEALQEHPDVRLLYLSSGGTLYGDRASALAREADPLLPRSYHGAGKVAAEVFVQTWARQFSGCAIVLRPSNIYGPGQLSRRGFGIVPTAFERARDGAPFIVWGGGGATRDYLFVKDLIDLCMRAIEAPFSPGGHVFNAASGEALNVNQLLDRIDAVTGRPLERSFAPTRPVDITHIVLDNSAARNILGWHPRYSIEQGLERTWQWFLGHE